MKYYFTFIWGGVNASVYCPYDSDQKRNEAAKALAVEEGTFEHDYCKLNIDENGVPTVYDFSDNELEIHA